MDFVSLVPFWNPGKVGFMLYPIRFLLSGDAESSVPENEDASRILPASPQGSLSRLNESSREADAAGLRNMAWKPAPGDGVAPALVDIDWLVAQPLLPFLVHVVPAQTLYRSLLAHGLEDSIEVLEVLRGEQLVRVLDFDLWRDDPSTGETALSSDRILQWVSLWNEVRPGFAIERLLDLEDETLTLAMSALLRIEPEGVTTLSEAQKEEYWLSPDRKFHLQVISDDPEAFELVKGLVESLYARDARVAAAVLGYSAMLVRQETLVDAQRWRQGRLADAGFVPVEEARSILAARETFDLRRQIADAVRRAEREVLVPEDKPDPATHRIGGTSALIDPEVFDAIQDTLRQMPPEQGFDEVVRALGQSEVRMLLGTQNPWPEQAMEDDELLNEAAESLAHQCHRLLFKVESLPLRRSSANRLLVENCLAAMALHDEAKLHEIRGVSARLANTILSFSTSEADEDALSRALTVVRGGLNLALESLLDEERDTTLPRTAWTDEQTKRAEYFLHAVGPALLFQYGWNLVGGLVRSLAGTLDTLAMSGEPEYASLAFTSTFKFDDGSSLAVTLPRLVAAGRFVEIRRWLEGLEAIIPQGVHFVLSSVLNRIPLFPEIIQREFTFRASDAAVPTPSDAVRGSAARRAFTFADDLSDLRIFVENLPAMLKGAR